MIKMDFDSVPIRKSCPNCGRRCYVVAEQSL